MRNSPRKPAFPRARESGVGLASLGPDSVVTGSFRGLIRFNSKETRGTERQSLKCALGHYTTWPLARPLNERRKNFDNDEIAQEPAVAKRMVSSDAQGGTGPSARFRSRNTHY